MPVGTTVGDLLYQQGITYDGNDLLTPDADKPILDGDQITLQQSRTVRWQSAHPAARCIRWRSGRSAGGNNGAVFRSRTPDADKPILDGDQITLQRVEYERYTEDEEIPYQTVRKNTSLIRLGRTQTIQQGAEGRRSVRKVHDTQSVSGPAGPHRFQKFFRDRSPLCNEARSGISYVEADGMPQSRQFMLRREKIKFL